MKKKLIIYSISFVLVILVSFAISFAWFTNNKRTTSGLLVPIGGEECTFQLESYNPVKGEWEYLEEIELEDMWPGDVFYFRFKLSTTQPSVNVNAEFEDISTTMIEELEIDMVEKILVYNDVTVFEIDENNQVKLENGDVLYDIAMNDQDVWEVFVNDEYAIEHAMATIPMGSHGVDYEAWEADISGIEKGEIYDLLLGPTGAQITSGGAQYCYFALEYLDLDDNSCYSYQNMHIDHLNVTFTA